MASAVSSSDIESVAKKQRVCAEATGQALVGAISLVSAACDKLQAGADANTVVKQLSEVLQAQKLSRTVANATQHFHEAIKNVGKVYLKVLDL
jgi:hypothetical protein